MNETTMRMLAYIRNRMSEPSTYPALILIFTAVGHYSISPELRDAIIDIGLIVAGLIGATLPDRVSPAGGSRITDVKTVSPTQGDAK